MKRNQEATQAFYEVTGGVPLSGKVQISGSKNATLPILAATLLTNEPVTLKNVPEITDVKKMCQCLGFLGKKIRYLGDNSLQIESQAIDKLYIPTEARDIRASILLLGPLLAKHKQISLPLPGGCVIGKRPIDFHINALNDLGVDVVKQEDTLICTRRYDKLKANTINFPGKTVTGTENIIMAAILAEGTTRIQNAAMEPEIADLIDFLNKIGADIKRTSDETIEITGVSHLHGCQDYSIIGDRIEAGTYLVAAAITEGCVTVKGINPQHMEATLTILKQSGAKIDLGSDTVTLEMKDKRCIDLVTEPFPGVPTDMQSLFLSLATTLPGTSMLRETIFESRFQIASELQKMGAKIDVRNDTAQVTGPTLLQANTVHATDLRSGAAIVCTALAVKGTTVISGVEYIERGYEKLVPKLIELGAKISLIKPSKMQQSQTALFASPDPSKSEVFTSVLPSGKPPE